MENQFSRKFRFILGFALLAILMSSSALAAEYDFEGRTVRYYTPHNMTNHHRLHFSDHGRWQDYEYAVQATGERFNANVEVVNMPTGSALDMIAASVLSGETDATYHIINWVGEMAALEGLLLPLDDVLDEEWYSKVHPSFLNSLFPTTTKGKVYLFPGHPEMPLGTGSVGVVWNKDLFEQEGLPNLYDLWDNGEWTWDAFKEIALQATKDTDGDGVIDQWGLVTGANRPNGSHFWVYMWHWAATNGADILREEEDGRVVFAFDDDKAYQAFEFWYDLEEAGAIQSGLNAHFMNGKVAMSMVGIWVSQDYQTMEEDYGYVPLPRGPQATEHTARLDQYWVQAIPVTATNPRALVELSAQLNLTTDDYRSIDQWAAGFKDTMELRFRDRETWNGLEWMIENSKPMRYRGILAGIPEFIEAMGAAITGKEKAATAMNRIAPLVQTRLDEVFGQ